MTLKKTISFYKERNYRQCLVDAVKMVFCYPKSASLQLLLCAMVVSVAWSVFGVALFNDFYAFGTLAFFLPLVLIVVFHSLFNSAMLVQIKSISESSEIMNKKYFTGKNALSVFSWLFPINFIKVASLLFVAFLFVMEYPLYIKIIGIFFTSLLFYFIDYLSIDFLLRASTFGSSLKTTFVHLKRNLGVSILITLCCFVVVKIISIILSIPYIVVQLSDWANASSMSLGDESAYPYYWLEGFKLVWLLLIVFVLYVANYIYNWSLTFYTLSLNLSDKKRIECEKQLLAEQSEKKSINNL